MPVLVLVMVLLTGCASVPRGNCHLVCDVQAKVEVSDETSIDW